MNLLFTFLTVAVGVCQGATYSNSGGDQDCSYPTWTCDCKLVYECDDREKFPDDVEDDPTLSGYVKDLAPKEYPLRISGKKWRKNKSSWEKFCKGECEDRMNAFLCLNEDGSLSDYSYSAVCLKLLGLVGGPFSQDGTSMEPCCTIYLEYGPQWCSKKWYRAVDTARCLARAVDSSFGTATAAEAASYVFSVEGGCAASDAAGGSFTWCSAAPTCAPGSVP